jgi:iron-sulfur cluster assembly accessory protein
MNITLTDAAKAQMKSICDKQGETTVRYWLDGGGCSGLMSKWGFTELEEGDTSWDLGEGRQFVIDKLTITYMDGATIDYGGDFMPAFKIGIPNRLSCGCGASFQA